MPLITNEPVILKQANKWKPSHIEGRWSEDGTPSVMLVIRAYMDDAFVESYSANLTGESLRAVLASASDFIFEILQRGGTLEDVLAGVILEYGRMAGIVPEDAVEAEPVQGPIAAPASVETSSETSSEVKK
jgi:hypothetical protein